MSLCIFLICLLKWCCGHMTLWCCSCFPLVGYEGHTHIFNYYRISTTVGMQDIIKQWPILCLLPMCTTDSGISIVYFWHFNIILIQYIYINTILLATLECFESHGKVGLWFPINFLWVCKDAGYLYRGGYNICHRGDFWQFVTKIYGIEPWKISRSPQQYSST